MKLIYLLLVLMFIIPLVQANTDNQRNFTGGYCDNCYIDTQVMIADNLLDCNNAILCLPFNKNESNSTFTPGYGYFNNNGTVINATLNYSYYKFNGINNVINTTLWQNLFESNFTVYAWVRSKNSPTGIVGKYETSSKNSSWRLTTSTQNNITFISVHNGTGLVQNSLTTKGNITDYEWHMVGGQYNGSQNCVYLDNLTPFCINRANNGVYNTSFPVVVGGNNLGGGFTDWFGGYIDSIVIVNKSINDTEWQEKYSTGKFAPSGKLVFNVSSNSRAYKWANLSLNMPTSGNTNIGVRSLSPSSAQITCNATTSCNLTGLPLSTLIEVSVNLTTTSRNMTPILENISLFYSTQPSILMIDILPQYPNVSSTLSCEIYPIDNESSSLIVYYNWYHNGVFNKSGQGTVNTNTWTVIDTLAESLVLNDYWECRAKVDDTDYNSSIASAQKTVQDYSLVTVTTNLTNVLGIIRSDFYGTVTHGIWGWNGSSIDANADGTLDTWSNYTWHRSKELEAGIDMDRIDGNLATLFNCSNMQWKSLDNAAMGNYGNLNKHIDKVRWGYENNVTIYVNLLEMPSCFAKVGYLCSGTATCTADNLTSGANTWYSLVQSFARNITNNMQYASIVKWGLLNEPDKTSNWLGSASRSSNEYKDEYNKLWNATWTALHDLDNTSCLGGADITMETAGYNMLDSLIGAYGDKICYTSFHAYADNNSMWNVLDQYYADRNILYTKRGLMAPWWIISEFGEGNWKVQNNNPQQDLIQTMLGYAWGLNTYPSNLSMIKYQWMEDSPYNTTYPYNNTFSEFPKNWNSVSEPGLQNQLRAGFNATKYLATYHEAGRTVSSFTTSNNNIRAVVSTNATNDTYITFINENVTEGFTLSLTLYPAQAIGSITDMDTGVSYTNASYRNINLGWINPLSYRTFRVTSSILLPESGNYLLLQFPYNQTSIIITETQSKQVTSDTILESMAGLDDQYIKVLFNTINGINWTQYYEFYHASNTNITETLDLLSKGDTLMYFQVLDYSGNPIKDAKLRLYNVVPTTSWVPYTLVGQRLTSNIGQTFFILDSGSQVLLTIQKDGYEIQSVLITPADVPGMNVPTNPYKIYLGASTSTTDTGVSYYIEPYYCPNTSYISFNLYAPSYSTLNYNTNYNPALTEITKNSYDVFKATLDGSYFDNTASQNYVYIYDGANKILTLTTVKAGGCTVEIGTLVNSSYQSGGVGTTNTASIALYFILLVLVAGLLSTTFPEHKVGFHTFMIGSLFLFLVASTMWLVSLFGLLFYVFRGIHNIWKD